MKRWEILHEYLKLNTHRFASVDEIRDLLWPGDNSITYSRVTNTIARLTKNLENNDDVYRVAAVRNCGYYLYTDEMLTAPAVPLTMYFLVGIDNGWSTNSAPLSFYEKDGVTIKPTRAKHGDYKLYLDGKTVGWLFESQREQKLMLKSKGLI